MDEALVEFRASIRLRPNEADAYLGLATALVGLGRNDEAIIAVETADWNRLREAYQQQFGRAYE